MNDTRQFVVATLRITAGILIWGVHFLVIYGYTGLACARRFEAHGAALLDLVPWVIGASTAIGVALCAAFIVPGLRRPRNDDFSRWMSAWIAALAVVAMTLEAAGVLWIPLCA